MANPLLWPLTPLPPEGLLTLPVRPAPGRTALGARPMLGAAPLARAWASCRSGWASLRSSAPQQLKDLGRRMTAVAFKAHPESCCFRLLQGGAEWIMPWPLARARPRAVVRSRRLHGRRRGRIGNAQRLERVGKSAPRGPGPCSWTAQSAPAARPPPGA